MSFNIGKSMKKLNLNWVNSDEEKKIKELFPIRLLQLIREKYISRRALAKELGLSSVIITKYIHGDTMPSVTTLVCLADYFNVSVDYLLGRKDEDTSDLLVIGIDKKGNSINEFSSARCFSEDMKNKMKRS